MLEQFARTHILYGDEALDKFEHSRVAVFGIGGVGGYVCEALARSGIGELDLIDNDTVSLTNINRQIIATLDSVGRYKTEVMADRIKSINPYCKVNTYNSFFLPENSKNFPFEEYDYVVDAIDTVTGKIEIIVRADELNVPVISSMGAGNKLDPSRFRITDIYKTTMDPLAKVMRRELKKRGIKKLKVVFSDEQPIKPAIYTEDGCSKRAVPGSTAFVPSVAGLIIASQVINDIAGC